MRPFHMSFAGLLATLPDHIRNDRADLEYVAWSGGQTQEFDELIITP
jgi:hypothetical protein